MRVVTIQPVPPSPTFNVEGLTLDQARAIRDILGAQHGGTTYVIFSAFEEALSAIGFSSSGRNPFLNRVIA